jgi:SAM-dependent methyltransferase
MATLARRFIDLNVTASTATERRLRLATDKTLWQSFERAARQAIAGLPDGAKIVDLGGGRRCVYHHALRPELDLIAVDVSAEELALNPHATQTVVADVSHDLPLPPASVDLLLSRAVLEHVPDVRAAARHMARALKPGSQTMHLLPGRYSLFGMAARVLPFKPLLMVLHRVMPKTIDQVEFDVFYDQGWPDAIEQAFTEAGFRDVTVEVTWAQPGYFEAIYPLFLLHALYERVLRTLGLRRMAAYMVVSATR